MVNPHKGTAQALKRGVQFKSALADVKNNVSPKPAKWKAPSISLKTQVGVGGLTIKTLMDSENITYEEAVQVYLAYQDSQRSPASSKKSVGTEPEEAALKNQVTPKARPSKAKEATETPPKRGRSSEAKADKSSKWGNTKAEPSADPAKPPKSKRGKTAEAKVAEPSHVTAEPSTKSKRGKTTEAEGAEPSPDRAEPTRKSKRGKTTEAEVAEPSSSSTPAKPIPVLKRGRASSDLSKHETEVPARRVLGKKSPTPQEVPSTESVQPSSEDWGWGGDDADTVWYEYDLWRQGLPQLSELDADLKKHREQHGAIVPFMQPTENDAQPAENEAPPTENKAPPAENEAPPAENEAPPSPTAFAKQLDETLKEMLVI